MIFLQCQKELDRPGHLAEVDKKTTEKEEKASFTNAGQQIRRAKYVSCLTSLISS